MTKKRYAFDHSTVYNTMACTALNVYKHYVQRLVEKNEIKSKK